MAVSTTSPLSGGVRSGEKRLGLRNGLLQFAQSLVKLSRFKRSTDTTYAPCSDPATLCALRTLRATDIAAVAGLGFAEWHAVQVSFHRNSAEHADRERRDMLALGELIEDAPNNALRIYGLLMRSPDGLTLASLSSLTVKFWSVMADGRIVIHSAMTPHGRTAWTRRLTDLGMSRREIDQSLPLHDVDDAQANIYRRESTKPLTTVCYEHRRQIESQALRGNAAQVIDSFNVYAAIARRERMHT
jgi:hypothetical protein